MHAYREGLQEFQILTLYFLYCVNEMNSSTCRASGSNTLPSGNDKTKETPLLSNQSDKIMKLFLRLMNPLTTKINPLNPELNPICYLLALLGAHHFLHVSRIRVKLLTLRRLMSYTYGAPILDVSRSHTTTQHSR